MQKTHGVTHFDPDTCWGCRIQTIQVTPSATPTRGKGFAVAQRNRAETTLRSDLDAYKRMRRSGHNPKSIDGAAEMERRAESAYEVDSGQLASSKAKGIDAGRKDKGKEWRKRANEAYDAVRRGETVNPFGD